MQTQQTETPGQRQDGRLVNRQDENRPKTQEQTGQDRWTDAGTLEDISSVFGQSETRAELKCHRTFLKMESVVAQMYNIYPQLCGNITATIPHY